MASPRWQPVASGYECLPDQRKRPWAMPRRSLNAQSAQDVPPPVLRTGAAADTVTIDGLLREPAWAAADAADAFTQTDPAEGVPATLRTTVRVPAGPGVLVIGVMCEDDPDRIGSFSVIPRCRAAGGGPRTHRARPFRDGRSGYVFAVNPRGARYDSLIISGGDAESVGWDSIWEASTASTPNGWSAEIRIPIRTLIFKPDVDECHFNVERRIQRLLETDRWASASRQYRLRQTSRAGLEGARFIRYMPHVSHALRGRR